MIEHGFISDVKKKYPHAYSLAPKELWEWIDRNYINHQQVQIVENIVKNGVDKLSDYKGNNAKVSVKESVDLLTKIIKGRVDNICTGNISSCSIKGCSFHGKCQKHDLTKTGIKLNRLRSKYKIVDKYWKDYNGVKRQTTYSKLIEKCNYILGENIFEHKLVKDNEDAICLITSCRTINNIIEVMNNLHAEKYGYRLRFTTKDKI